MMKSEKISSQIEELESELDTLTERRNEVQESLNMLTDGMASSEKENGSKDEMRGLQVDRNVLDEAIERKAESKAELEAQLQQAIDQEADEKQYQEFCQRAEKAQELREKYYQKAQEINALLEKHIPELAELRQKWKEHSKDTLFFAESIAKGFQTATAEQHFRNGENSLPANELIKRAKADEISLKALFDREITTPQHWYHAEAEMDFPTLIFSKSLQQMINSNLPNEAAEKQK